MTTQTDMYNTIQSLVEGSPEPYMPQETLIKTLLAHYYDVPADAIPNEFFDFLKIVSMGAKKYALNNWLEPDGVKSSEKDMHASMFRHLANSSASQAHPNVRLDTESGLDHLLHLICRAQMLYTRRIRQIRHKEDK